MQLAGSFAPPLGPSELANYKLIIANCTNPQVKEAMTKLHGMVVEFQRTPRSKMQGSPHASGMGVVVPLEPEEVARMDQHVPWREELDMYDKLFDALSPIEQRDLRNAAFHLLWYGYELLLDREPITKDQLGA